MKLSDELVIAAPQATVWAALNDPAILQRSIEGCTRLEQRPDGAFDGTVQAKIGPVRASFQGVVTISAADPPNSYVLSGEGKGGVAGFAKGQAHVNLISISPAQTQLRYEAEAAVGGKIAQLGARLIESTARDYASKFFAQFKSIVEDPQPVTEEPLSEKLHPTLPADPVGGSGLPGWLWATGVIALLALMLWYAFVRT